MDDSLQCDQFDRERINKIIEISQSFLNEHDYSGSLSEDLLERTILIEFENITSTTNPVDLFFLLNIVDQCKPYVKDCTVSWDRNTASHLSISIELFKNETTPPPRGATYEPACPFIQLRLKEHIIESNFEMRNAPSSWKDIYPKLEQISQAMYARGESIPTPSQTINYGNVDAVILDFGNNDSVTYSFIEYLTSLTGITAIEAKGSDFTLSICVDDTEGVVFTPRF